MTLQERKSKCQHEIYRKEYNNRTGGSYLQSNTSPRRPNSPQITLQLLRNPPQHIPQFPLIPLISKSPLTPHTLPLILLRGAHTGTPHPEINTDQEIERFFREEFIENMTLRI